MTKIMTSDFILFIGILEGRIGSIDKGNLYLKDDFTIYFICLPYLWTKGSEEGGKLKEQSKKDHLIVRMIELLEEVMLLCKKQANKK